ncbi:haloacid dehalogenase [Pseudohyphozyma bogoriensis]|nr:haloacid dehalogenase [Pseudohyphozyma bogoriensis]
MDGAPRPKALLFDLMGTCLDWHTSILEHLLPAPSPSHLLSTPESLFSLATAWRAAFFKEIVRRFEAGEELEDIDVTHRRTLDKLLEERGAGMDVWGENFRNELVQAWHKQSGEFVRSVVLANGTVKLQLDLAKSSGVPFHTLLSSQLLGHTKPDPKMYLKALDLIGVKPEEAVMVAAHAYDVRAAASVGMQTVYVHRATEDTDLDMHLVRDEFDLFIDGTSGEKDGGLVELARHYKA